MVDKNTECKDSIRLDETNDLNNRTIEFKEIVSNQSVENPKNMIVCETTKCYVQQHTRSAGVRGEVKKRHNVLCANCGGFGHIYKNCNHPIISYGIICYKLFCDPETNITYPKYLMVQRKDSLSYVEFIRGKYNIKNRSYVMELFTLMTEDERSGIAQTSFDVLWQNMWCKSICDENRNFTKEYKEALDKFEMLKNGYHLKTGQDVIYVDLKYILDNTKSRYNETEWGFPKGRRNINEGDINCALREFKEESGLSSKSVKLCTNMKSFEEVFSGTNKVRYKHVYYIAQYVSDAHMEISIDPKNKQQCKEIRNVQWYGYNEAQSKIRDTNIERKELFKRLNQIIVKHTHL